MIATPQLVQTKIGTVPSTGAAGGLLQRQCDCGNHTMSGECGECSKKKGLLQRQAAAGVESTEVPPIVRLQGHDFSRVHAHAEISAQHRDASEEEEGTERAMQTQAQLPGSEAQDQRPAGNEVAPGHEAIPANVKGTGTTPTCPTKATVDTVTNKDADGVKYRTGMGAVTTIKVDPDTQNWDGTNIVESFPKGITSNCPKEFGITPCNGSSTFIVGASRNSPVFGTLPATKNLFYDFHETRWKGGSLLHDRNPASIDSCTISCEQNYSCGGKVIGKPIITRTFTKAKVGTVDVTNVNVAKA
jgi:hypothetical protein